MENKNNEEQNNNLEKHPKQDFQVERLAFFSDAAFAIAITLLVIEFKIPDISANTTFNEVLQQLFDLKFHFVALLASFCLIAIYWKQHHLLFKYINNYNNQIIFANMFVLLPIIFFPFTTTVLAECFVNLANTDIYVLGLSLFLLNNFFATLAMSLFYWITMVKYKEMSLEIPKQEKIKFNSGNLFRLVFFGIIPIVALITKNTLYIALAMIIIFVWRKLFAKKLAIKLAEL